MEKGEGVIHEVKENLVQVGSQLQLLQDHLQKIDSLKEETETEIKKDGLRWQEAIDRKVGALCDTASDCLDNQRFCIEMKAAELERYLDVGTEVLSRVEGQEGDSSPCPALLTLPPPPSPVPPEITPGITYTRHPADTNEPPWDGFLGPSVGGPSWDALLGTIKVPGLSKAGDGPIRNRLVLPHLLPQAPVEPQHLLLSFTLLMPLDCCYIPALDCLLESDGPFGLFRRIEDDMRRKICSECSVGVCCTNPTDGDRGGPCLVYSTSTTDVRVYAWKGGEDPSLARRFAVPGAKCLRGIDVSVSGRLAVCDEKASRVTILTSDGDLQLVIGGAEPALTPQASNPVLSVSGLNLDKLTNDPDSDSVFLYEPEDVRSEPSTETIVTKAAKEADIDPASSDDVSQGSCATADTATVPGCTTHSALAVEKPRYVAWSRDEQELYVTDVGSDGTPASVVCVLLTPDPCIKWRKALKDACNVSCAGSSIYVACQGSREVTELDARTGDMLDVLMCPEEKAQARAVFGLQNPQRLVIASYIK